MIYLDHHATTPCDPRVLEAMMPYFTVDFANPGNTSNSMGRKAGEAVRQARCSVAELMGASPVEILLTSGATESNNLAILGAARRIGPLVDRRRILYSTIEHKSVMEPCRMLAREGFEPVPIPVDGSGRVQPETLTQLLGDRPLLVSIQAANNEIGTLQDIKVLVEIAHRVGALFHCDAAQAMGKVPIDTDELGVDLLSVSAHKMYGPKGVGALYIRGGRRAIPLEPLLYGGGQEDGLRSGTYNVPGLVGFGEAARIATIELADNATRISEIRDQMETALLGKLSGIRFNGHRKYRLPGNSSLTFPGTVPADVLVSSVPDMMLSTGSACNSGAPEPSHVLQAIGLTREEGYRTIRVGLGRLSIGMSGEALAQRLRDMVVG